MKRFYLLLLFCVSLVASGAINPPENLKTDYNKMPLGIDNPAPGFSWEVGDESRGAIQSAYRILVSSSPDLLNQEEGDIWDSGKIDSGNTIQIKYEGKPLKSSTRYYWAVKTWNAEDEATEFSKPSWFETGLFTPTDWQGRWITDHRDPPENLEGFYDQIPVPLFRKSFTCGKKVKNARIYISGLGYYEAFLNGEKAGDHLLDPGWTQYANTVYYAAYDVTEQIHEGENILGVVLGNGWYNPLPMKMFGHNLREVLTIGKPKVLAQLRLEYEDGSMENIVTDESWKTETGPVVKNNIYLGEWYDARKEHPGWKKAGFNDNGWQNAALAKAPAGELKWQFIPPVRHTKTVKPVKMNEPEKGVYVMDLGQNFAGIIRFKAKAPKGTEIRFRYAEMVHENGNIDIRSSAAAQIKYGQGGPGAPEVAWQEDRYICKGDGIEVFEPKFTFHGFRYVEITGLPYQPSLNDLEGLRLNTDLPAQSEFYCSNPLFNKIQEITEWAMLSNVFSVQSDCPAREKYGYGGDMVAVGEAYIYNYDMANFYTKTVRDFARDALPDGGMTECAPNIGVNARGVTEESGPVGWTLAHPFLLQKVYKYYGDLNLVKEQYDPLKDLVNFYHRNVPDHIIMVGIGDHKCVDQRPTPVSSTAFYYHHVKILAKMAGLLDKKKDQEFYADLAEKIKAAFIKAVGQHAKKTHSYVKTRFFDLLNNGLNLKNIINLRIVELNKVILYRITHIENISHILQHGITHRDSINKNPFYKNIGDLSLIDTRSKRKANIDNGALNPNNDMVTITLGDFIPFYFGVKMPMLYVAQHGGNFVERPTSPADIVYLGCSLSKIISSQLNFYFSDGHATDMLTSFYDNSKIIELVNIVDWEAVKSSYWGGAENLNIKRKKQAEFLVSGDLSPDFIIAFGCFNENAKDKLISLGVVSDKIKIIPQAYY